MRAGGEERGPFPGVFYERFRKWPICFGRSDYVSLSGPQMFPSLSFPAWISALLGLPSPIKALIMQSSLYELNSVFHFFFKLHGNPHSHLFLSHFIFNPPGKGDMATTVSSLVHPKNVYLVSEECHFFPGKLLTNELASLPAIWGLLPWGTMHAG